MGRPCNNFVSGRQEREDGLVVPIGEVFLYENRLIMCMMANKVRYILYHALLREVGWKTSVREPGGPQ